MSEAMSLSGGFKYAEALLVERIQQLRAQIGDLERELDGLRGNVKPVHRVRTRLAPEATGEALTCAAAIDAVLTKAAKPLRTSEILSAFKTLPQSVQGTPSVTSVRSVITRRHEVMGWKQHGKGRGSRWSKPNTKQEGTP